MDHDAAKDFFQKPDDWKTVKLRLQEAGLLWREKSVRERIQIIRRVRHSLRTNMALIMQLSRRPRSETFTAEILPLMAACRFLERKAASVLRTRKAGLSGAPLWLFGTQAVVERRPFGAVLILSPGNYPLLLGGIQTLQGLMAGNAVALKPAPGTRDVLALFTRILMQSGLPDGIVVLLGEEDGPDAASAGFDLIVLTGSAKTGRAVAHAAAKTLTPTIMELSGSDAAYILPGADLDRAARALAFAARLNGGATCIAPRRVFVTADNASRLSAVLKTHLRRSCFGSVVRPFRTISDNLAHLGAAAYEAGAEVECHGGVTLFAGDGRLAAVLSIDLFEPWIGIIAVRTMDEALSLDAACPYALGASVFGPENEAGALARLLPVGSVCINDVILPTADPRLPFSGTRESGHGVTRGPEGLLAMTRPVSISRRRAFSPHQWL